MNTIYTKHTWIKSDASSERNKLVKFDPISQSSPAQNDDDMHIAMPNIVGWDSAIWKAANPPWLEPTEVEVHTRKSNVSIIPTITVYLASDNVR